MYTPSVEPTLKIKNGEIIRCTAQSGIWGIENNKKRYYNTPNYNAFGRPPIRTIEDPTCRDKGNAIPRGADMIHSSLVV